MSEIRIYVGTYNKYNEGSLYGKWLDLEDYLCIEDFYDACKELHNDESDPELMFQDYEGIPDSLVSESHIDEKVWDYIELDDDERIACRLYEYNVASLSDTDISDALDRFYTKADSISDFVEEHIEGSDVDVPEWVVIDAMATWNYSLTHEFIEAHYEGEVWFFHRNS